MTTTGLIAVNPAWPVEEGMADLLDWCARRLAADPKRPGHWRVSPLPRA
jgi:23S rRNA (adenine2030-N6)-methyltransferase